jgi:hypothetical protein
MPAPSKVDQLPEAVRQALEQRLIAQSFSGYVPLVEWLSEQGFEISKSSVQRWGSQFEDRVSALKVATDQAKAIVSASPDDEGAMTDALLRLVQEKLFSIMLELEVDPKKVNLSTLAKSIAQLGRASIAQKKHMVEMRAKLDVAREDVRRIATGAGVSDEIMAAIDARLQGAVG